jgi:hypothetical protein
VKQLPVQEYTITMPVLPQELFFTYLRRVEQLRFHLASIRVRTEDGDRLADSVLRIFGQKIQDTAVPEHLEHYLPNKRDRVIKFLCCDAREVTKQQLLSCFWSSHLFPVRPYHILRPHKHVLLPGISHNCNFATTS